MQTKQDVAAFIISICTTMTLPKLCVPAAVLALVSSLVSCGKKSEEEKAAQQAKEAAARLESAAKDAAEKIEKADKLSGNASVKAQKDLEEAKKRAEDAAKKVPPGTN